MRNKLKNCLLRINESTVWSFVSFMVVLFFTYLQAVGYIFPGLEMLVRLRSENTSLSNTYLMWVPIISYFMICLCVCLFINTFIKKLKKYEEKGLIWSLVEGLVGALIFGFSISIMMSIVLYIFFGTTGSLDQGMIRGFAFGSIVGIFAALSRYLPRSIEAEFNM